MSYDGFEIDMLNLGDADSILVTRWTNNVPSRVLIDGGNVSDSAKVISFLKARGATYLDHIVCSHPHDDHAAGLVGVVQSKDVTFGSAWMHLPWNHVNFDDLGAALRRGDADAKRVVKIVRESVETGHDLYEAITARGKLPAEPFEGTSIGFLKVCGPTQTYHEELLADFTDYEKLKAMDEAIASHEQDIQLEEILEHTLFGQEILEKTGSVLGGSPTQPENNSSTILGTIYGGETFLFTADAGVEGLTMAKNAYQLADLRWMQIPHHGSRRNVTSELIEHFNPQTAYVSASGSRKHPRRAVVNAFKNVGAKVYSTHYPLPNGSNKWFHRGSVPDRPEYSSTKPLYD